MIENIGHGNFSSIYNDRVKNRQVAQPVLAVQQTEEENDKEDLQVQKQTLENQLLLMANSSDSTSVSEETQKKLKEQIEKISAELRTAKADIHETKEATASIQSSDMRMRFDSYEAQIKTQSAGLYEVTSDENGRQVIKFNNQQREIESENEQNNSEEELGSRLL